MNKKKENNFENALNRLEEISDLLENEDTPLEDSIKLFETDFYGKNNMVLHQVAYAKDNGNMKFYYDKNDLSKCYSLLPLPQFGEDPAYIDVPCKNLTTIMQEDMPQVDIIKADIEGVWYDFCTEILTYDVPFKAFLIEKSNGSKPVVPLYQDNFILFL